MPLQPIYLFADSQLLFWRDTEGPFLTRVRNLVPAEPKAAYIGASNGDDPQFYSIFEAAMEGIGIRDCRMILSSFSADDESFVFQADIILLAGGDIERGWKVFSETGLGELIIKRYSEGALLIGISAGAVQLGLFGIIETEGSFNKLIDTFNLVPFAIGAHDEGSNWRGLRETIQLLDGTATGIGIPSGAGLVYHPDGTIEALRNALTEFTMRDGVLRESLLIPGSDKQG